MQYSAAVAHNVTKAGSTTYLKYDMIINAPNLTKWNNTLTYAIVADPPSTAAPSAVGSGSF